MIKEQEQISVRTSGRVAYVKVRGKIDRDAPHPNRILQPAKDTRYRLTVLDLSDAEVINSDGLVWLERVSALAEAQDVRVRVVSPRGSKVRRILELMRFDRFMVLAGTLIEAMRFGRRVK